MPDRSFGPKRLAEHATRHHRRVLVAWGLVVLVSFFLIGALLPSALTSDNELTNNPESGQAEDLIDARLPQVNSVDEVIVVRSEESVVTDPAFARQVRAVVAQARDTGSVAEIHTYLEAGGGALVSAGPTRHNRPAGLGREEGRADR